MGLGASFVLTCFAKKVLSRRRSGLCYFGTPSSFCVPECLLKVVRSSAVEKDFFFFSISAFTSEGKAIEAKEFMITEGAIKGFFATFQSKRS